MTPTPKLPPSRAEPVLCAWCEEVMGYSDEKSSHGICDECFEGLEGVPALEPEELDDLPYGVIELDDAGVVRTYNATEQELSGRSPEQVVGRSFFRDVAPCTRVRRFEGRWREFYESPEGVECFRFTFPFPDRPVDVHVAFVHGDESTFVMVRRVDTPSDS